MTGHGAKFPRKMEESIAALLSRPSIDDAARVVGVEPKTLRRWMRVPEFNAAYLQARREGVGQTLARMQQGSGAASRTILKLMLDPNAPAASDSERSSASLIAQLEASKWRISNHAWRQ